jgi:DNA-binding Xre family transcriptional regulator
MNRNLKARIIQCFGNQTDFARLLQISEDRLSKIVHGRVTPREPEREAICKKLGATPSEIFPS